MRSGPTTSAGREKKDLERAGRSLLIGEIAMSEVWVIVVSVDGIEACDGRLAIVKR